MIAQPFGAQYGLVRKPRASVDQDSDQSSIQPYVVSTALNAGGMTDFQQIYFRFWIEFMTWDFYFKWNYCSSTTWMSVFFLSELFWSNSMLYVGSINIFHVPLSTLVLKNVLKLSMLNFNQSMSFIPSFIIFFKIKTVIYIVSNYLRIIENFQVNNPHIETLFFSNLFEFHPEIFFKMSVKPIGLRGEDTRTFLSKKRKK